MKLPIRSIDRFLIFGAPGFLYRPSDIANRMDLDVVINGDQWSGVVPTATGTWAGAGLVVQENKNEPTMYIDRRNQISFRRPRKIWHAISGNHMIMVKGRPGDWGEGRYPRTAVGVDRGNRNFLIAVADGNEAEGTGATFEELFLVFREMGAYYAMNLDGGGSSTLVIDRKIANVPSDDNVPGRERPVINVLGIRLKEPK